MLYTQLSGEKYLFRDNRMRIHRFLGAHFFVWLREMRCIGSSQK